MKTFKIRSKSDKRYGRDPEWAEIHHDDSGYDPFSDCDQPFEMWSNIPRELGSSKGAYDPMVEAEDEDGYGTGEYRPMSGHVVFPVSVMIHSGIWFSLGTRMCMFGDTPVRPGGRGWDTTPNAVFLYTYKACWEKMMGKGSWMRVRRYDPESHELVEDRPAKDIDEFADSIEHVAEAMIKELNLAEQGSVYGYTTHKRVHYKRIDDDGTETDCWDTEDGDDSCWGFLTDDVGDIDFPRDMPVYAGRDCDWLEGEEYKVNSFGLRCEKDGSLLWVKELTFKADDPSKLVGGKFHVDKVEWTEDPNKAEVHRGKWHAEWQARQLKEAEGIECEIVDLDTVEGYDNPVGKWDVPLPEEG